LIAIALRSATTTSVEETPQTPIEIPTIDPTNQNQIGNMAFEVVAERIRAASGDAERGKALFTSQSCSSCHTDADGQTPKGPHLVDIGRRYNQQELVESILKPSEKIAQGFDTYAFVTTEGEVVTGFVVLESSDAVRIRQQTGVERELAIKAIDLRNKQDQSMMPQGVIGNLTVEQFADLLAYLQSLD
jgi:putative heme-binding domain-containing protein